MGMVRPGVSEQAASLFLFVWLITSVWRLILRTFTVICLSVCDHIRIPISNVSRHSYH